MPVRTMDARDWEWSVSTREDSTLMERRDDSTGKHGEYRERVFAGELGEQCWTGRTEPSEQTPPRHCQIADRANNGAGDVSRDSDAHHAYDYLRDGIDFKG
jgi:hypothetical protein